MYVYKNRTDKELIIPNVGTVEASGTITSAVKLESPNLEEVTQPQNTVSQQAAVKKEESK